MATPPVPVAPVTLNLLSFLQSINIGSIEAEIVNAEQFAPFALALLSPATRTQIARNASFVISVN